MRFRSVANISLWWIVCLIAVSASGQEYRSRIQGSVLDTSKAAVPGANITILNVNTGVSTATQTDERGHYLFDLVLPGTYNLTVESQGFNRFVEQKIVVQSRADVTIDATLKAGDVVEAV